MRESLVSAWKHMAKILNSYLMWNADGLLAIMDKDSEVKWVGEKKNRVNISKFEST